MTDWWEDSPVAEAEPKRQWWEDSPVAEAEPKRQWWEDSAEIRDKPQDISTAFERAGHVWDSAQKSNIPLNEADQLFNVSAEQKPPVDDGLIKRFGKKFYNSAVANVVQAVATKSEAGQIKTDIYTLSGLSEDFRQRAETNQGVTLRELEHYAKPKEYKRGTIGSIFGFKQDEWKQKIWEQYERGELNLLPHRSPEEEIARFIGVQTEAEERSMRAADIGFDVAPPETITQKLTNWRRSIK